MKVVDFIDEIGDLLQEDFVYAPVWTRTELLGYLKQVLNEFSVLTLIADRSRIQLVDNTTGEADLPVDFNSAYYLQFNRSFVDIVQFGDLEFVSSTWALNATGTTPAAATLFGSGTNAKLKFVPVPSTVTGSFGSGTVTTLVLVDGSSVNWTVTIAGGVLVTTAGGVGGVSSITLRGTTGNWDVTVNDLGVLITTASVSDYLLVHLTDTLTGESMDVYVNATGGLVTKSLSLGIITRLLLDTTAQTLVTGVNSTNANYGVVVDLYATGVSVTPTHVGRCDRPYGEVMLTRTADYSAEVWYKGLIENVNNIYSELFVSPGFTTILKHGVLALAYAHEGDGQDLVKAQLLRKMFTTECTSIKRLFNRK